MIAVRSLAEAAAYCHHHRWSRVASRAGPEGGFEWDCVREAEVGTLRFTLVSDGLATPALDAGALVGVGTELLASVPVSPLGFVSGEIARAIGDLELALWALKQAQAGGEGAEVADASAVAAERLSAWRVAVPGAPSSRPLAAIPTPAHGFLPPPPLAEWLARSIPFAVEDVPADLRVVARGGDGRFLVRHEAHTMAWLRVEGDQVGDIQVLQDRAALAAFLAWGFTLLDGQKAALRRAAAPGEPVEAFLKAGLAHGRARAILGLRGASEETRFYEIELREPRFRGALLVVRVGANEEVLGFRVVEGVDGYEMMGMADATAPHLPGPAGERPIIAAANAVNEAMRTIAAQVQPLLEALVDPARTKEAILAVRPRVGDAARVFAGDAARIAAIEHAYQSLWAKDPPRVRANAPAVTLKLHVAPAGMLGPDSAAPQAWPVPYSRIAAELEPSRTWVAWSYLPTGGGRGTDFDGLVWLDDRWVWFPAPWRVLPRVGAQ
ncbi:hypothetical protein LBMAG42_53580 [Deltaproteobacteria bacterium]|nr:hypothetical protein LBMAG42_53580 [Deltaproteobacteria bacterium]